MYKVTEYGSNLSTSHLHKSPGSSVTYKWRNPPNLISCIAFVCASLKWAIMPTKPNGDILDWKMFLCFVSPSAGFSTDCMDLGPSTGIAARFWTCCFFFRDLCSLLCFVTESCAVYTWDLGLFFTSSFFLVCDLTHFFALSWIFLGLDFVPCFIFFILLTNTSSSQSDSSTCLGGGIL